MCMNLDEQSTLLYGYPCLRMLLLLAVMVPIWDGNQVPQDRFLF
jgi:hypothetical protein